MKGPNNTLFASLSREKYPRSVFDRTHTHKSTFNPGYLIPFYRDEVLPGDTFKMKTTCLIRLLSPLKYPIMDNMYVDFFFFYVPNRLTWENWQKFCGEKENPDDDTEYSIPYVDKVGAFSAGTLYDYLGLPTDSTVCTGDLHPCAFFTRAYNLIYREWFRSQDLIDSPVVDTGDGPDDPTDYVLRKRTKRHDYFTSCLPQPQKGDSVKIPLGTIAPVYGDGKALGLVGKYGEDWRLFGLADQTATTGLAYDSNLYGDNIGTAGGVSSVVDDGSAMGVATNGGGTEYTGIYADLQQATAATINDMRLAVQWQRMLERDQRGGTRYWEILQSHFGITSPDSRLQRPEYLGGGHQALMINPVVQTSFASGSYYQGNLAAYGLTVGKAGFTKSFVEHGVVIGMLCVYADLTYQQGTHRMFHRQLREDFYWPELAHLGEMAVLNKEIYTQGESIAADNDVFGYQEMWAEYRYGQSMITGLFRSTYSAPLDYCHLAQKFASLPTLAQTFIEEDPPIQRASFATMTHLLAFDCLMELNCARPMPVHSIPGRMDHL